MHRLPAFAFVRHISIKLMMFSCLRSCKMRISRRAVTETKTICIEVFASKISVCLNLRHLFRFPSTLSSWQHISLAYFYRVPWTLPCNRNYWFYFCATFAIIINLTQMFLDRFWPFSRIYKNHRSAWNYGLRDTSLSVLLTWLDMELNCWALLDWDWKPSLGTIYFYLEQNNCWERFSIIWNSQIK